MDRNGSDCKNRYVIDRFEGRFAACERMDTGARVDVPRELIGEGAGEGAVIAYDEKGGRYEYDAAATERRAEYMRSLAGKLWK